MCVFFLFCFFCRLKILYGFHVFRSNYRAAAYVMYTWAERLVLLESEIVDAPTQELVAVAMALRDAYLVALTALRLVDQENAWVVTNVQPAQLVAADANVGAPVPQNLQDPELNDGWVDTAGLPAALTIREIEQLYALAQARCELLRVRAPGEGASRLYQTGLTPADTVALLCDAAMFDMAVTVSKLHSLTLELVIRKLADACVRLSIEGAQGGTSWFAANDSTVSLGGTAEAAEAAAAAAAEMKFSFFPLPFLFLFSLSLFFFFFSFSFSSSFFFFFLFLLLLKVAGV